MNTSKPSWLLTSIITVTVIFLLIGMWRGGYFSFGKTEETSISQSNQAAERTQGEPVHVSLLGEDTPSEEVDIGQIVPPGWEYRFEGPSTTRVLFDDGTSGPITQNFGVKGGKIRFTGPDGQKATVRPIPPRSS